MAFTWQLVAVLVAILVCATYLTVRGLIPAAVVTGAIGTVLGWMIPAPRTSTFTRRDDPEVKP